MNRSTSFTADEQPIRGSLQTDNGHRTGWKLVRDHETCWLVTPEGQKFYACGVNGVNFGSPPESLQGRPAYYISRWYPGADAWAAGVRARLVEWGFNHLGAWASAEEKIGLPYIPNLDLGRLSRALWYDPFNPRLPTRVNTWAERLTAPHRQRGLRIGYFPDNEVGWWNASIFAFYLGKGWENHTKRLLWRLLYDRYAGKWQALLDDWVPPPELEGFQSLKPAGAILKLRPGGTGITLINEFTFLSAQRYYKLVHDALRSADPDALIFSDRLPIYYSQDAVAAMTPYVDAVAVNYNIDGADGWIAHYFFEGLEAITQKPILVSEFFCAAMENRSGNKNTGHLLTVTSQAERELVVQQALKNFALIPSVIGTQWFQYYDEPQGGRADGEDYNVGLVDIYDEPYQGLVTAFKDTHSLLCGLHAGSTHPPREEPREITIPRAPGPVDLTDGSLTDWDKDRCLMRGFSAEPPYVPFADVYLSWDSTGLYLASIGMDYMHPEHLACEEFFPLSESYQIHLLILRANAAHHFAVHFIPQEIRFSPDDHTNARGSIAFVPYAYTYPPGASPRPLDKATVQYLNASAPRISCEAHFPAELLRLSHLEEGMRLKMNIVVISHYRAQEMFWSEGTAAKTFTRPEGWRTVTVH